MYAWKLMTFANKRHLISTYDHSQFKFDPWLLGKWKHLPKDKPLSPCEYGFHFYTDFYKIPQVWSWHATNALALVEVKGPTDCGAGHFSAGYRKHVSYSMRVLAYWLHNPSQPSITFDSGNSFIPHLRFSGPPVAALPKFSTIRINETLNVKDPS